MEYEINFKPFGIRLFYAVNSNGNGWFRILGVGLHWKDTKRYGLTFSERFGYRKAITIRGWRISLLLK